MEKYWQSIHALKAKIQSEQGRLLALVLACIVPFIVMVAQLGADLAHRMTTVRCELTGLATVRSLNMLLLEVATSEQGIHRYLAYGLAPGDLPALHARIEHDLSDLAAIPVDGQMESLERSLHLSEAQTTWLTLRQELEAIAPNFENPVSRSVADSNLRKYHQQLQAQLQALIADVGDEFDLVLDPELDVSYLTQAALGTLPRLQAHLVQLQLMGEDVVRKKALSSSSKTRLIEEMGKVQVQLDRTHQTLNASFRYSPTGGLESAIAPSLTAATSAIQTFLKDVTIGLIDAEAIAFPMEQYNAIATAALSTSQQLGQPVLNAVDQRLRQRLQPLMYRSYALAVGSGGVLVVVLWGTVAVVRTLALRQSDEYPSTVPPLPSYDSSKGGSSNAAVLQGGETSGTASPWNSEAFQSMALNAASMGAWDWDICTGAENWSPQCENIFGLPPGSFSGHYRDFLTLVHPDDRDRIETAQRQTLSIGAPYAPEYRIIRPDGAVRWLRSCGSLLQDGEGQPLRLTGIVMDITTQKEAEQALAESERRLQYAEEKYRSIFENAVTGIFQTTPSGQFISANPALARIYGYESVEAMIEGLTDIGHQLYVEPQRRQEFMQLMQTEGRVNNFESQIYRADGQVIWIAEHAVAIPSDQGAIAYLEGTVEDITERKQAQAALRESEERFRTLLTNIPGVFYRCAHDAEWTMEFLSEAIADICGYAAEDFVERRTLSLADIVPDEDYRRISASIATAVDQRQPYVLEYRMFHANGSIRWVYEKGQAIFRDDGTLQCLDGVIFDITERKRTEQFQNLQRQILEAIASGSPLADTLLLLVRAIEDQSRGSLGGIFLLSGDDRPALRLVAAPSIPPGYLAAMQCPIGEGQSCCGTAVYRKEPVIVADIADSPLWGEYQSLALAFGLRACWAQPILAASEEVLGVVVMYHQHPATPTEQDWELIKAAAHLAGIAITRQRTEEELYRAKTAAEDSNRAKSQFLANMSHELRTPLNAIIGYSEMLQEDAGDLGASELVGDLGKIQQAGKHLLTLINDILDISKIEAGRMEVYCETVDIQALVRDVEMTILPLAEQRDNRLDVRCAPNVGMMHTDGVKLRQVLLNLLSNAAKFTEHGQVVLDVEGGCQFCDRPLLHPSSSLAIAEAGQQADDWILFRVTDTGIGMTAEQLQHVFQPFTQADASTTRRYGGTGLGLAISRHFCQMMGGDISVCSTLGEGSTFTVLLPRTLSPGERNGEAAIAPISPPSPSPAPAPSDSSPSKACPT